MDFIKKHFEKIILAIVLVALIVVAVILAIWVNNLNQTIRNDSVLRHRGPAIEGTKTGMYTNAIAALESPALWTTNAIDPFGTGYVDNYVEPDRPKVVPTEPFTLIAIHHKHFPLVFVSYTGDGENIQINDRKRSYIGLKIGDEIKDEFNAANGGGWFIKKFEHKEIIVHTRMGDRPSDISELTVEKANILPVILIYRRVVDEKDPEAVLVCNLAGPAPAPAPPQPNVPNPQNPAFHHGPGDAMGRMPMLQQPPVNNGNPQELTVHKGQIINCGGKDFKVIDINSTQVIIIDVSNNEQHIYTLDAK
jgi:hypothetical protein